MQNMEQAVQHLIDITINKDKLEAYNHVIQFIETLKSMEQAHYDKSYIDGYYDKADNKQLNLNYYKENYNVQSTTNNAKHN